MNFSSMFCDYQTACKSAHSESPGTFIVSGTKPQEYLEIKQTLELPQTAEGAVLIQSSLQM